MTDEQNERAARVWREAGGTWPGGQAKEVLDDFRAAFASRDETYWLIERRTSPPQWTKGHPATFGDLTADVHQAMRYATEHQALDALRMMPSLPEVRAEFFACEHMWVEPPSARITGDKDRENPVEGAPLSTAAADMLRLWFFRECNSGTRRQLFSLFGLPLDEIRNQGTERLCFDHILAALGAKP